MFNIAKKAMKDKYEDDDLDTLALPRGGAKRAEPAEKEKEKPDYSKFTSTPYTEAERAKLLIGYDRVPEEAWTLLLPKTHVRYITQDGKFRRGGFVHNVQTKGKPRIFLETGFDAKAEGYAKWPVTLEDVAEIWKKRSAADVRINEVQNSAGADAEQLRAVIAENAALRAEVDDLNAQVDSLAADQKKLVQLVSKINERVLRMTRGDAHASPKPATPVGDGRAAVSDFTGQRPPARR